MKTYCENCKKERIVREIYLEIDGKTENWCQRCRINYKKDSRLLEKLKNK